MMMKAKRIMTRSPAEEDHDEIAPGSDELDEHIEILEDELPAGLEILDEDGLTVPSAYGRDAFTEGVESRVALPVVPSRDWNEDRQPIEGPWSPQLMPGPGVDRSEQRRCGRVQGAGRHAQGPHHRGRPLMAPRTLTEKIWDAHANEPDLLFIDLHLLHEVIAPSLAAVQLATRLAAQHFVLIFLVLILSLTHNH